MPAQQQRRYRKHRIRNAGRAEYQHENSPVTSPAALEITWPPRGDKREVQTMVPSRSHSSRIMRRIHWLTPRVVGQVRLSYSPPRGYQNLPKQVLTHVALCGLEHRQTTRLLIGSPEEYVHGRTLSIICMLTQISTELRVSMHKHRLPVN